MGQLTKGFSKATITTRERVDDMKLQSDESISFVVNGVKYNGFYASHNCDGLTFVYFAGPEQHQREGEYAASLQRISNNEHHGWLRQTYNYSEVRALVRFKEKSIEQIISEYSPGPIVFADVVTRPPKHILEKRSFNRPNARLWM